MMDGIAPQLRFLALAAVAAVAGGCGDTVSRAKESQSRYVALGSGQIAAECAEHPHLEGYTLPELVDWAFTNRPSMAIKLLEVEDSRLALRQLDANAPVLSSSPLCALGSSVSLGRSESSNPGRHLDGDTHGGGSGSLSLDILVWDSGRHTAEASAQSEAVLAAELSAIDEGYAIFDEVVASYFGLLRNEALLEVAITNEIQFAEHLYEAERRLEEGEAVNLDVLKARLDLAKAREAVVGASNDVETAGADLMAALGVDASRGGFRDVLGERKARLDSMAGVFAATDKDAGELFSFARTNAPAMQAVRARLRAASSRVDYAIADLGPRVSASLSLNWADPLWYWRWGLNVAQDLFTGFRKTTAVERARNAMDQAAATVEQYEQDLSHRLEIAVAERDNAREALSTAETSVGQAKENLDAVSARFSVGDVHRVEFTDAVAGYATALGGRIKAVCRGQIAEAKLFVLAGSKPEYGGTKNEE